MFPSFFFLKKKIIKWKRKQKKKLDNLLGGKDRLALNLRLKIIFHQEKYEKEKKRKVTNRKFNGVDDLFKYDGYNKRKKRGRKKIFFLQIFLSSLLLCTPCTVCLLLHLPPLPPVYSEIVQILQKSREKCKKKKKTSRENKTKKKKTVNS